jgi:hypothetical protein
MKWPTQPCARWSREGKVADCRSSQIISKSESMRRSEKGWDRKDWIKGRSWAQILRPRPSQTWFEEEWLRRGTDYRAWKRERGRVWGGRYYHGWPRPRRSRRPVDQSSTERTINLDLNSPLKNQWMRNRLSWSVAVSSIELNDWKRCCLRW